MTAGEQVWRYLQHGDDVELGSLALDQVKKVWLMLHQLSIISVPVPPLADGTGTSLAASTSHAESADKAVLATKVDSKKQSPADLYMDFARHTFLGERRNTTLTLSSVQWIQKLPALLARSKCKQVVGWGSTTQTQCFVPDRWWLESEHNAVNPFITLTNNTNRPLLTYEYIDKVQHHTYSRDHCEFLGGQERLMWKEAKCTIHSCPSCPSCQRGHMAHAALHGDCSTFAIQNIQLQTENHNSGDLWAKSKWLMLENAIIASYPGERILILSGPLYTKDPHFEDDYLIVDAEGEHRHYVPLDNNTVYKPLAFFKVVLMASTKDGAWVVQSTPNYFPHDEPFRDATLDVHLQQPASPAAPGLHLYKIIDTAHVAKP